MDTSGGAARAEALLAVGRPEQALAALAGLPPGIQVCALRAAALLTLERYEEAVAAARDGLAADGPDPTLLGYLGGALQQCGRFTEAERALSAALAQRPADAGLLCRYASLCLATDRVAEAGLLVERAGRLVPRSAAVHATRVRVAMARKDHDAAEDAARRFLADHPDSAQAHALHGWVAAAQGRLGTAYASIRQAAATKPTDPDYARAARQTRVYAHPLLLPLRPLYRLGAFRTWAVAVAVGMGLRLLGLYPLALAFTACWLLVCVYSWVMPPLVRRFTDRP